MTVSANNCSLCKLFIEDAIDVCELLEINKLWLYNGGGAGACFLFLNFGLVDLLFKNFLKVSLS